MFKMKDQVDVYIRFKNYICGSMYLVKYFICNYFI